MDKVSWDFYLQDTLTIAKELLGKYLIRVHDGEVLAGRITETEAYIGDIDKACHAYNGKVTNRTKILYENGGISYVYLIYGMYYCMNVVTEREGKAAAVLLRGVSVVKGFDKIANMRYGLNYKELTKVQLKNISNGPGKLCKCFDITKDINGEDLCGSKIFICNSLEGIENIKLNMKVSKRIGIDYAKEAKDFMWRFYLE